MVKGPVRVAGLGAWLPSARGTEAVSARLSASTPAFEVLSTLRWDFDVFASELPPDQPRVELGATLGEPEIDWRALKLPPRSVSHMHTMEQVALAVMHDALRDAGITAHSDLGDRTRVYLAATTLAPDPRTDHGRRIRRHELTSAVGKALSDTVPERAREVTEYVDSLFNLVAPPVEPDSMSSSASILAGRICNMFDLRGGHIAIDASTASSLAALEVALEDLASGACDVALVAAVSPLLTPSGMLAFAHRGVLGSSAPLPYASASRGTLLGEGAVAMVLDRGHVAPAPKARGWIESVAAATLAQRGRDRLVDAIGSATSAALAQAAVKPSDVAFVATRAAGITALDGPEAAALAQAYGSASRSEAMPIATSADVFGHLSGASGLVAVLHALLALEEGQLSSHVDGQRRSADLLPASLQLGAKNLSLSSSARAGVSDAGLAPRAYHAIVAGPLAHRASESRISGGESPFTPLAITGMGVCAPGAPDVGVFWSNVLARVESIGDLPRSRWDVDRFVGASEELGAILKTRLAAPVQVPPIDPALHRLSKSAAHEVDPAVILSMDCARQALEDAGGSSTWSASRVGVVAGQLSLRWSETELDKHVLFAGHLALVRDAMREAGFTEQQIAAVARAAREEFAKHSTPLGSHSLGARTGLECAAHVARVWGFEGPILTVDGACASSLAAIERASRDLASHKVDAAVAIGVAYNLLPEYYIVLSILGALSPRGAPPFHLGADGFVPGEGAAAIVLERLSDAERREARIHAILRGIGTSSDGGGLSIFAPNGRGEERAIGRALASAHVVPRDIDLVEAHGTGTKLGDETEISAYRNVYGDRDPGTPLTVGTVKSQIGHLSSAAGMVGMIKTALALREAVFPPSLGDQVDPRLELERGHLRVPADARPWVVRGGRPRRAGVSAFGLGGINYHVILEEPSRRNVTAERKVRPQAQRPARSPRADRFDVELVPLAIGTRSPRSTLRGRVVWLIPGSADLAQAMQTSLERSGARVIRVTSIEECQNTTPADGIVDLSAFGRADEDPLSPTVDQRATERVQNALAIIGVAYDHWVEAPPGRCFYVAVTSLGGDLGLLGADRGDLSGAALVGLAKGLKQELPKTATRAIDFDPEERPETVAEHVIRELEDGNDQLEVAYAGRRFVPRLRRLPLAEGAPVRPVSSKDVVLVSGGGRGVVFECATALARLGAKVVVCGRTQRASLDAVWLDLGEAEFSSWSKEHMLARKRANPGLTARALRGEIESIKRARELETNLRRAKADDLPIDYIECDIAESASVERMVAEVRRRYGSITGIAHGAMVQWSTLASRKEPQKIADTLSVKVKGLATLLAATRDQPLTHVFCFGSGAGRFGNRGQTDYCAANALMAARLAAARRADARGARFVTIDWTAWDSVGAAVEDPDLAELLRVTGITSISIDEGTYWFVREWTEGTSAEVVVFEERMLHDWPFLGRQAERDEHGPVEADDLGRPLVEGAWPMVDRVVHRGSDEITVERRLDVRQDAFIDQHRLHGVPILPATFGCELLAEVAALSQPGSEIDTAWDIRIEAPTKLFRERPLIVRARAYREEGQEGVRCETRSRLTLNGREVEQRVHHLGRFLLRPEGSAPLEKVSIPELAGVAHARSFFHMAKDPVMLGPLYCRGQWIQIHEQLVIGVARAPRERDATSRTAWPVFQVDPLMMDTAFQIAANWDGFAQGNVSIPYGIAQLRMGRRRRRGEDVRVRALVTRVSDPDVFYDIDLSSHEGEMLMQIRGLHLRRIGATETQS